MRERTDLTSKLVSKLRVKMGRSSEKDEDIIGTAIETLKMDGVVVPYGDAQKALQEIKQEEYEGRFSTKVKKFSRRKYEDFKEWYKWNKRDIGATVGLVSLVGTIFGVFGGLFYIISKAETPPQAYVEGPIVEEWEKGTPKYMIRVNANPSGINGGNPGTYSITFDDVVGSDGNEDLQKLTGKIEVGTLIRFPTVGGGSCYNFDCVLDPDNISVKNSGEPKVPIAQDKR